MRNSHKSTASASVKKKEALHHQFEYCSGLKQSPFLCLCDSRNMVVKLLGTIKYIV